MSVEAVLVTLFVGLVAGWLATLVLGQWGYGLLFNIVIGILGGLLATWLFPKVGISLGSGLLMAILTSALGALIILVLISGFQRVGFFPRRSI